MQLYDGALPSHFRMLVSGSSATGKSTLIHKILLNENGLMEKNFERVIYLQGMETQSSKCLQQAFNENMICFNNIPSQEVLLPLCKSEKKTVLVIEDMDDQACSSPLIAKFFRVYSHHLQVSVIISTQNIFCAGKERLTLIRNSTHLVIFPNFLDMTVIRMIAQKIYPKNPKLVIGLFEEVTKNQFGYLSVWGNAHPALKFRSHITEPLQLIYTLN